MNKKKALFTSLAALALASTQAQTFADEVDATIAEPTVAEVPAVDEVTQDAPVAESPAEETVAGELSTEAASEEPIAEDAPVEADLLMTTYAATDVAEETPVAAGAEGTATLTLAEVLEGAELDASLPEFFYAAEGTFVPDRERQVYNYPDLNEPVVATYQAGEAINFDRVGTHPGMYIWVSYQSDSGIRRYVKVGNNGTEAWIYDENDNQIGKEPLFGEFVATVSLTTEEAVVEEVNPYEVIYAETISSFETYPEYREGVSKEYALVDIDGNGVPELIFGASAQGFAAVYTIDAGQVVPVAQEVNGQPRGGVGIASNGDIVHVAVQSVGQGLYVTSIYRLRPEGGFDLIERQEFQVGDGQVSIIADYTFLSWDDLTPWTATKSEVGRNDAVEIVQTVTQTPQLTTGDIVHVPLTAKTELAVAPAKESKPAKETYSRAEKAQSDKGILPETGEVTSVLGAIGASLSALGLVGLKRRKK